MIQVAWRMRWKGPRSTSVPCAPLLLLSCGSLKLFHTTLVRNFMSKDRRRRSESSRDSINVTDKIQHGFSCEGPVNHYGSPITGREGTFRLPRRVVSFHGSSIFYLYFATLEGEWLEKNMSVFPNLPRRAYADRGRMDGDQEAWSKLMYVCGF